MGDLDGGLAVENWIYFLSHLSFAFTSAVVCHCKLLGFCGPPLASGMTWSITYPLHRPDVFPVAGHGCDRIKALLADSLRLILPFESRGALELVWVAFIFGVLLDLFDDPTPETF